MCACNKTVSCAEENQEYRVSLIIPAAGLPSMDFVRGNFNKSPLPYCPIGGWSGAGRKRMQNLSLKYSRLAALALPCNLHWAQGFALSAYQVPTTHMCRSPDKQREVSIWQGGVAVEVTETSFHARWGDPWAKGLLHYGYEHYCSSHYSLRSGLTGKTKI